jgi:myosin-5
MLGAAARKRAASSKSSKGGDDDALCFRVVHYAATVQYDAKSFLKKNADHVHADITNLLAASSHSFTALLMDEEAMAEEVASSATKKKSKGGNFPRRSSALPDNKPMKGGNSKSTKKPTLGSAFKLQLSALMSTLRAASPHFVRCLKPNDAQVSEVFESMKVLEQLRCTGLLGVCRIRQVGYPMRMPLEKFFTQFKALARNDKIDTIDELIADLVEQNILQEGAWAKGRDKIFFKGGDALDLESFKERRDWAVVTMSRMGRGMLGRLRIKKVMDAIAQLESGIKEEDIGKVKGILDLLAKILPDGGQYLPRVKKAAEDLPKLMELQQVGKQKHAK